MKTLAILAMAFFGCAEIQGYHRYDEEAGYPIKPGSGSAHVSFGAHGGPGYGHVNGYTTTPEAAIREIANATVRDAQAECMRTGQCYGYYGGRYSRPGYTLSGANAAEAWKSGKQADDEIRKRADAALRGAKLAAKAAGKALANMDNQDAEALDSVGNDSGKKTEEDK
jgi:hypothetical protein